jgi:hypothetical protein
MPGTIRGYWDEVKFSIVILANGIRFVTASWVFSILSWIFSIHFSSSLLASWSIKCTSIGIWSYHTNLMDPFDEWVKTQSHPCLGPWADRLIELGSSWDSFRRESKEVVQDLVAGGIPLLAARDIVNVASEVLNRTQAPMAIFWDIENLQIPSSSSGRDVATRLKTILSPHGNLVQFRGYANIGEGNIPQQKRSDLQLSGCHLVDCPHVGRKEVVDKMIIVDAMQFAFTHPQAATLCFITGDVDYAYLLAVLQQPQWQTIVISKGTIRSMLHVNCDMKMRWETDILQMRLDTIKPPPGFRIDVAPSVENERSGLQGPLTEDEQDNEEESSGESRNYLEALTRDEEWDDDVELLRMTIRGAPFTSGGVPEGNSARKSYVGNVLRQTNPARFHDRDAVKDFLAMAIENKAVIETGEGAYKALNIGTGSPNMVVSDRAPISIKEIPPKVLLAASSRPFLLFVGWGLCPKGKTFPERAFVQQSNRFAILMFRTLTDALRDVNSMPWLRGGRLVDWRRLDLSTLKPTSFLLSGQSDEITCVVCKQSFPKKERIGGTMENGSYCSVCSISLTADWVENERIAAIDRVVVMLEMLVANDDVYIARGNLRKLLVSRWPAECPSRTHGSLWIHEAIKEGKAVELARPDIKGKLICLASSETEALSPFSPASFDTSSEEDHVETMLWGNNGWEDRANVIASLKDAFERMATPVMRTKVFMNAAQKERFFIGKAHNGQVVVLNKDDVKLAVENLIGSSDGT